MKVTYNQITTIPTTKI